ncbi:hypothetical protein ACN9MH_17315 [Paenibacillus silvae]|uniref:hypothetical protein n=1 Tax=Paenibacillus silvae TaxID=1325358 RepID=UPI003CF3D80A
MSKQQRRIFTTEFKKHRVQLYENGKPKATIVEEMISPRSPNENAWPKPRSR